MELPQNLHCRLDRDDAKLLKEPLLQPNISLENHSRVTPKLVSKKNESIAISCADKEAKDLNEYADVDDHAQHWFAMRVTYSREMKVKKYLDSVGVQNFIPMHYVEAKRIGAKKGLKKVLAPVIHNFIFVKSCRQYIDEIKQTNLIAQMMRYIMNKAEHKPIIVPENEMQNFITVSNTNQDELLYLTRDISSLKQGDRVRVNGGVFDGVEGELIRIKGDRRVVVRLQGLMAIATTFIEPRQLEKI